MTLNLGTIVARRLTRAYRRIGLSLTVTDSATSTTFPVTGRVTVLVFDEQAANFTSAQTAGWARPAYKIQIAGDFRTVAAGPFINDVVALPNGAGAPGATLDYTVRKVDRSLFAGVVYRTTLYVSRNV